MFEKKDQFFGDPSIVLEKTQQIFGAASIIFGKFPQTFAADSIPFGEADQTFGDPLLSLRKIIKHLRVGAGAREGTDKGEGVGSEARIEAVNRVHGLGSVIVS